MGIGLKVSGSFPDNSGYGESNRADVAALFLAGVDITTESVLQTTENASTGWVGKLINQLEGREIDYKIKLIHLTADLFPKYAEEGKYNILRIPWETDRLPKDWIAPMNTANEIWTMTENQAKIFKTSGITVPVHVFPEPLDVTNAENSVDPYIVPGFNGLIFYSAFQWIERKDPYSLLTTYWKTFEGREDVLLLLKTFRVAYSEGDFSKIKEDIARWKASLKLKHYPQIGLIKELWPTEKVWKLHKMGGVFVSTSHGEGWSRCAVEAGLAGNPIISTGQTGFADELPADTFYPIKATPAPVIPQSWISWYEKYQNWLNIDTQELSKIMLNVYEEQKEAKQRGLKARTFIKDNFNYHKVGTLMRQRLEEVSRIL